jgi:hypothetical protein
MARRRRQRRGAASTDRFVQLHVSEMESPAFTSLSCTARALLLVFRMKYYGQENRIDLGIREMATLLGVTEKPATKARDELLIRGWIIQIERGSFSRKTKLASTYALTNISLAAGDSGLPLKLYMSWQEGVDYRKFTVEQLTADGGKFSYRKLAARVPTGPNSGSFSHRESADSTSSVGGSPTHLDLPSGLLPVSQTPP